MIPFISLIDLSLSIIITWVISTQMTLLDWALIKVSSSGMIIIIDFLSMLKENHYQ